MSLTDYVINYPINFTKMALVGDSLYIWTYRKGYYKLQLPFEEFNKDYIYLHYDARPLHKLFMDPAKFFADENWRIHGLYKRFKMPNLEGPLTSLYHEYVKLSSEHNLFREKWGDIDNVKTINFREFRDLSKRKVPMKEIQVKNVRRDGNIIYGSFDGTLVIRYGFHALEYKDVVRTSKFRIYKDTVSFVDDEDIIAKHEKEPHRPFIWEDYDYVTVEYEE